MRSIVTAAVSLALAAPWIEATPGNAGAAGAADAPDLIVHNARVWTGDAGQPRATAFAVVNGRFGQVGEDDAVRALRGDKTQVVDAGGQSVIPGLCDAHLHLVSGGVQLAALNLREVPDRAAFVAAVAERAKACAAGEWITGGRWSTESWPDPAQPSKEWIDPVTKDVPVLLSRMDGHGALANSAALKRAGIDRDGPTDPVGGRIERDPKTREPTGILKESAIGLVSRHVPAPSAAAQDEALRAAIRHAHEHGLTCVHTMSPWSDVAVIERAAAAGSLTLRIRLYVNEGDWRPFLERAKTHRGNDLFRIAGFKQFMDGSLGSRTAYMAEPYADNPPSDKGNRGLLREVMDKPGHLEILCRTVDAAGFDPAMHAIGDQANHLVLDVYERVRKANPPRPGRRMRIEHAQHLLPADIPRFAELRVIPSMQPLHKCDDGRYAEKAIGARRCQSSYAFRALLDAKAALAFGSDWPVVSLNPFEGIRAAVTGMTLETRAADGRTTAGRPFVPGQNITVEEALRAYTAGGAYAAGDEGRLGAIKPGYLADFVILKSDPFAAASGDLAGTQVQATYVGGRRVWP